MLRFFETLTIIGAVLATIMLILAVGSDMSAPQQGAGAAMALCFVVIPYCVLGMLQRRAMLDKFPPRTSANDQLEPLDF